MTKGICPTDKRPSDTKCNDMGTSECKNHFHTDSPSSTAQVYDEGTTYKEAIYGNYCMYGPAGDVDSGVDGCTYTSAPRDPNTAKCTSYTDKEGVPHSYCASTYGTKSEKACTEDSECNTYCEGKCSIGGETCNAPKTCQEGPKLGSLCDDYTSCEDPTSCTGEFYCEDYGYPTDAQCIQDDPSPAQCSLLTADDLDNIGLSSCADVTGCDLTHNACGGGRV